MKTPLLRYIPLLALTGVLSLAAEPELKRLVDLLKPVPELDDPANVEQRPKVKISRKVTHHEKPKDALAVKGLFNGMDIEDAASRLKEVLAESSSGIEDITVTKDESGDGYYVTFGLGGRIDANSDGEVTSIYIDGMTIDSIFGADKMTPKEFA